MKIYRRKTYYLLFAVSFYIVWFLFKLGGIPDFKQAVISTFIDVVVCLFALHISVETLLPAFIYKKRYARFFLFFVMLILISGSAIILTQLKLMGNSVFTYRKMVAKYQEHYFYWFWSDLIFGSYFLVAFIAVGGCGIRLAFDKILDGIKMETFEKEKLQTDLSILKDQINPHFLFNALNTVYYQIDKSNLTARKTLAQFSSLLRYQLYECNSLKVPIEGEIEFLTNYINVQSERFKGDCRITCMGFESLKGFKIAPFILAPLVENCFKHVSRLNKNNDFIEISCDYRDNLFYLDTSNSFANGADYPSGGIGLSNVRKRLELSYPGCYDLSVNNDGDIFHLILKLDVWN